MNSFGVSLLILSICIILGQSKPRGHPKKCSDDIDCNPGYACKFIEKLGFKLCAKPKHHQEGGPAGHFRSAKLSDLTRAAAPVADESGPPPKNARNGEPKKGGAPPSSKTEEGPEPEGPEPEGPYDDSDMPITDDKAPSEPEGPEPEAGQPEDDSEYGPEGEDYPADADSDSEVPEEEGDPKGEDSEIGENGKYFLKIYKGTKLASATSTMALVVFFPHPGNPSSNMFCNIGSRPKSILKVKDFCHLLCSVLEIRFFYTLQFPSHLTSPRPPHSGTGDPKTSLVFL